MNTSQNQISVNIPSKDVWVGWIASSVEAYNMSIYSFLAPLIAPFLFTNTSLWGSLIFSYSLIFIGSCFLYPAGALYYGFVGDKKGRQQTCIYATLGLGLSTGLMGIVPFDLWPNLSWICFLGLIGLQHFYSGGEYHGSIVFSLEHATQKKGGLMSSMSCLFAVFGIATANGLASLSLMIKNESLMRLCFFVGGIGGFISYFLKYHCQETPAFKAISAKKEIDGLSLLHFFKLEWKIIFKVISLLAFFSVSYNFIFIFLPLLPFEHAQGFDTFTTLFVYAFFLVIAGWLADKFGIEQIMMLGLLSFALVLLPLAYLSSNLIIFQSILTPCACLVIGPIHSWMLQQFKIQHRCRGIFISAAITTALFGGSTVPLCLLIFEQFHSPAFCAIFPFIITLIASLTLGRGRITRKT